MLGYDEKQSAADGYRNVTPSFQVLMRQSSGRFKRKRRCAIFAIILIFGLLLIGSLFLVYILDDTIYGSHPNATLIQNNKTVLFSADDSQKVSKMEHQCPKITGVGAYHKITALFGGLNEYGADVKTIELIPKVNCSIFPRLSIFYIYHDLKRSYCKQLCFFFH